MRESLGWQSGTAQAWQPDKPVVPVGPEADRAARAEQRRRLQKQAEAYVASVEPLYRTIVRDNSLNFKVGDGFYIDLEKKDIYFDLNDFQKMYEGKLNRWQVTWSGGHELAHFHDFKLNPEGMLKHFRYMERRAKELMPRALEIMRRAHGDEVVDKMLKQAVPANGSPDASAKTSLEIFLYQKLHLLYNSLDDMYVNMRLAELVPIFAPTGAAGPDIRELYRTHLFPAKPPGGWQDTGPEEEENPAPNYKNQPRCHQLAYALLRERMVPDEHVQVEDEVTKVLDGFSSPAAEKMGLTLRKQIDSWTRPGANGREFPERDPVWRYNKFREKVEPLFVELLMHDLANLEPPPPPQPSGQSQDQGENQGSSSSPWTEMDQKPEHTNGDLIEKYMKDKKKMDKEAAKAADKAKKDADKTPAQRYADAQKAADRTVCERNNVSPKAAEDYRELQKAVEPYKRELAEVFEKLMRTIDEKITSYLQRGFKTGRFDTSYFINRYSPEIAHEDGAEFDIERVTAYARKELISRLSIYPNDFRVRLVVDGSGSMSGEKMDMARKVAVLLLEGLGSFEETMNLRYRLQEPFRADTQVHVFGSLDYLVKPFEVDDPRAASEVAKFKALEQMQADKGGTNDNTAFGAINDSIGPKRAEQLLKGKAKELALYIADGGSNTEASSTELIAEIQSKGVVCKGLLIGGVIQEIAAPSGEGEENDEQAIARERQAQISNDQAIFNRMFGEHGAAVPDISQVANVVLKLLSEEIEKTSIMVSGYEDAGGEEDEI